MDRTDMVIYRPAIIILGNNLKEFREQKRYTKKALAEEIGYDRLDLAKLEYGEKDIKLSTAKKIAWRLDLYLPRMFSEKDFKEYLRHKHRNSLGYVEDDYLRIYIEHIKGYLKTRGRQAQMGEETGMDPANISKLLNYKIKDPCISTLDTLARCIGKDVSILLGRTDDISVVKEVRG